VSANPAQAVVFDPSACWLEAVSDALSHSGITVVGQARELGPALTLVERHRPELLVADPAGKGLEAIRDARARVPGIRAIALGSLGDSDLVADAFAAGAAAFVVKTERFDTFGLALGRPTAEPHVVRRRETSAA
jgi:DNA-binding NarL/FixJ family response regulator